MKKINTYIGNCIKSRSIVLGQDRLKATKGKVYLIIVCYSGSTNLIDLATRLSEKFECPTIKMNTLLESVTFIKGCKLLGITNSSLASAILTQNDEFTIIKE